MTYTTRLAYEPMRSFDSSTLSGSYQTIGGPLAHPSYILKMVNTSNTLVTVSIDGMTDIDVCPAGSFFLYDEDEGNNVHIAMQEGTQFFLKGSAGIGIIYLVTQYLLIN